MLSAVCNQVYLEVESTFKIVQGPITWGGGVPPYMGHIGLCGPKGYGFSAVFVIIEYCKLQLLLFIWLWFLFSSLGLGMFFNKKLLFHHC